MMTNEFEELKNPYVDLSEGRPLSTPTLTSIIEKMCEDDDCDSQEFLELLTKLHNLMGCAETPFVNQYFYTGNGWAIMDENARKQHIVNYVYVNIGVYG